MKRLIIAGLALIISSSICHAQNATRYTLQQCIDTALANNIQVKQSGLLEDAASVNVRQAKAYLLPDLNLNSDHGVNQGRSIDVSTNAYVNQSVNYGTYGINSGITLFNGMSLRNNIKQSRYALNASSMELLQAKDNLTLFVILAYLTLLNNEDLLLASQNQKALSVKQLERLQILDGQGAISPSLVTDLKGQVMNDELSILNARAQLETSKLALAQLMNITYTKEMAIERLEPDNFLTAYAKTPDEVYGTALKQFSLIRSVELRSMSSRFALKSAKGALFPTLVLSGAVQTNYSSAAQNANGKIGYSEQVKNNIYSGLNLGLRIPIYNFGRARNNIKLAAIDVKNNELIEADTKNQLRQRIELAYLNMVNAYDRYKTLLEQVDAYAGSFKAADIRFAAGVGTSVDYLTAKNNLDRANISLIMAKYDFVLRKKVLDFYQNAVTK